ncbi:CehA/McbA family metallohydrolase [Sandarakinorhabdus cyanobacteriorum]|nr:CehA/McbA family metallohydrolase [Sandarakinorhabdus cyanobacteriorum]
MARTLFKMAIIGTLVSTTVLAHPNHELSHVRLTTAQWAAAIQSENEDSMNELLAPDFMGMGDDRQNYIATMGKFPITKVVWRYSEYKIKDGMAEVGPIVIYPTRQIKNPVAVKLKMRLIGEDWKIFAIEPGGEVPAELLPKNHPLQSVLKETSFSLRDKDTGEAVAARVHIEDANGVYWPPQFHMNVIPRGWREDIGGDVIIGGKTFAYVQSDFVAGLPAGRYTMEVARGLEYNPMKLSFEVGESGPAKLAVDLSRWTDMKKQGWYSGDSHVHFLDPQTALLEAQGEDLNVINVLASSGGDLITSVNHFTGAPSVHSTGQNIVYIAEETRHDYLGHTTLLDIKKLIYPMGWGEPTTGVPGGYDSPAMADQADKAHANGALVVWAHFPDPGGEIPIDFTLGKIDGAEVAVFGNPFVTTRATGPGPMVTWYRLLNTGSKVPGLGATDKMWNTQKVGGVRTYAKVDGPFSYASWIKAVRDGRTFVTSGPMISLDVDGHAIGDTVALAKRGQLPFTAKVHFNQPVERLEIIVNGKVVASRLNSEGKTAMEITGKADFQASSWIAARAISDTRLPIQGEYNGPDGVPVFAHTSPIYVDIAGKPRTSREDAAHLRDWCGRTVEWARTKAKYPSAAERERIVGLYAQACANYAAQAEGK